MVKLLLLSLLGKNTIPAEKLYKIIKAYLIVYSLILPGFAAGQNFERINTKPLDFQYNPYLLNCLATSDHEEVHPFLLKLNMEDPVSISNPGIEQMHLSISTNPFTGRVTISTSTSGSIPERFVIENLNGQVLKTGFFKKF